MPAFPFGYTVIIHREVVTSEDSDGNDVYTPADVTVDGVAVWTPTSTELTQGQDLTRVQKRMVVPDELDFQIASTDTVTIFGDHYDVYGQPDHYQSPLTGTSIGTVVDLTRQTG